MSNYNVEEIIAEIAKEVKDECAYNSVKADDSAIETAVKDTFDYDDLMTYAEGKSSSRVYINLLISKAFEKVSA